MSELYREHLLEHYRTPQNTLPLTHSDASVDEHNPLCGDRLHAELKMRHGRIEEITFIVNGCVISTASASLLSESIKGKTPRQVEKLDFESISALLKVAVSPGRIPCVLLPLVALKRMVRMLS